MFARELANTVGGDCRAVGKRLIVQLRQRVDEIKVIASDDFQLMAGVVAVSHFLCECRFVECLGIKSD